MSPVGGVTITGMGLLTPVGRGIDEVYGALLHGRSGIVKPPPEHAIANSIELAGILPPFDAGKIASGPDGKVMDRTVILAQLVAEGLSNKQVAARLLISERTAATHVGHILDKLGFKSRAQIAGWISSDR